MELAITTGDSEMLFVTRNGYSIRFSEKDVRGMGRTATGVKAINFKRRWYCSMLWILLHLKKNF